MIWGVVVVLLQLTVVTQVYESCIVESGRERERERATYSLVPGQWLTNVSSNEPCWHVEMDPLVTSN